MNAGDALRTAEALAAHGLTSDTATRADLDAAADHTGSQRPTDRNERDIVLTALATTGETR
ncbi:hypothetical protein AB0872_20545 [Microbacterium sp. NPDC047426]